MKKLIDIPIIVTVVSKFEDFESRIKAGATILNVSGGAETAEIVKKIREKYADFPIIATGGPNEDTIRETIQAGANAITYTPPSSAEILNEIMNKYRDKYRLENKDK